LRAAVRTGEVERIDVRSPLGGEGVSARTEAVLHTLALERDPEAMLRRFKRSHVRRNIAKAEREGVTVEEARTASDVTHVFYGLHLQTRRRQGVPVQPRRLFDLIWRRLIEPGLGFCLLAYLNGAPIAGAVFLTWHKTVVYKFGASDPRHWNARPNNLLFWEAISWGCDHGYETFDFGRTDFDGPGLRRFKLGWGSTEYPLHYTTLGDSQPHVASSGSRVLKPMIQRSPLWVTRALGELLYKYAA
jgi:lipid II:glycine glycyltransferase (peptidoglycan interpeptide bridge formation enzyme)